MKFHLYKKSVRLVCSVSNANQQISPFSEIRPIIFVIVEYSTNYSNFKPVCPQRGKFMTKCIIRSNLFLSRYIVDGGFSKEKDTLWRALEKFCSCKILSQKLRIPAPFNTIQLWYKLLLFLNL